MTQPNTNQFISSRQHGKRLEKLMHSGLINGYGQRVQIGFEYLVLGSRDRFNLKDLAERGAVVFGFLNLPGNDNSFAIMDSFRHFDRGGGAVSLEDFGAGVIERLYQYHNNNSLLKSIARELIPSGRRSVSEVLSLLSDPSTLPPICRSHLLAHLSPLLDIVRETHSSGTLATAPGALPDAQAAQSTPAAVSSSILSHSHSSQNLTGNNGVSTGNDSNTAVSSIGNAASVEYLSVSRFVECAQRALEISCAEVCACLHLSVRLRKQLQDESLTGYHYCLGAAEEQLTRALSRYSWDAGYPFWGGRAKADKKLLEGSEEESGGGSDGESNEDSEAEPLDDYEGPGSVLMGALQLLLPGEGTELPMELDEVQLYLLSKAQGALNQFICLLSDPNSPSILKEVETDMTDSSEGMLAQLDRAAAAKVSGTNVSKLQALSTTTSEGKGLANSPNALLLKELLDTQDKLLRAQIRLQVYQRLPPNVLECEEEEDAGEGALEIDVDSDRNSDDTYDGSAGSGETSDSDVSDNSNDDSEASETSLQSDASSGHLSEGHKRKRLSTILSETSDVFDTHPESGSDISHKEHSLTADHSFEKGMSTELCEEKHKHAAPFQSSVPEIPLDVIESRFTELEDLLTNLAGEDYVLGTLLERSCALVPYKMEHRVSKRNSDVVVNAAEQKTIQPFMSPSPQLSPNTKNRSTDRDQLSVQSKEEVKEEVEISISELFESIQPPEIDHMSVMLSKLKTTIAQRKSFEQSQEQMQMRLSMYEERVKECMVQLEQAHRERDDALSQAVEVQILREKNIKLAAEEAQLHHLQQKNAELSRTVAELQRNLKDTTELYSKAHHEENLRASNLSKPFLIADGSSKAIQKQIQDLTSQRDKLSKENQRIMLASKQADQRMKAALQDHVSLRQKLNKAEDELLSSKTVISNLLGEIDHERSLRGDRDTLVRKSQELHMEVVELRGVVEESRVASAQLVKTKEELARAEDQIALLVEKLDDITKEAELSSIGQDQLDNLRAAVAMKAKENRELVVQTHNLERKLQELQGLETRHSDLCDEVTELKFKVDQMPPLLAELARLRGSHRATARVLHEQEKLVSSLRMKCSELEADNARLKAQNRIIEDLQSKLQHSETDCKRYAEMTREIPSLNAQIKKLQEDYRSVDTSHRKLRKIMRQTAIMGGHTQGDAAAMG